MDDINPFAKNVLRIGDLNPKENNILLEYRNGI